MEQPDIEKEVKRLFRTDADAIDVKWEVITEEEKPESSGQMSVSKSGGSNFKRTDTSTSLDNYGEEISFCVSQRIFSLEVFISLSRDSKNFLKI